MWIACADKAHKVDGDGGARACSFTPYAAGTSTLVALRPPLGFCYPRYQISFLGPRQPLDSGELQQAGRRDTTRSFGVRSKACIDWAASADTLGRRSLEWTSTPDGLHVRSG